MALSPRQTGSSVKLFILAAAVQAGASVQGASELGAALSAAAVGGAWIDAHAVVARD